jgi:hypothetical protein
MWDRVLSSRVSVVCGVVLSGIMAFPVIWLMRLAGPEAGTSTTALEMPMAVAVVLSGTLWSCLLVSRGIERRDARLREEQRKEMMSRVRIRRCNFSR